MSHPTFSFSLPSSTRYGPRLGHIVLKRPGSGPGASGSGNTAEAIVEIATPGLLATTSRGAVPHLSRDHVRMTEAIRWVNVPFETFLEHNPPVPTLQAQQPGQESNVHPLHTFLGFAPDQHIVSMTARDPHDAREMPPNGNAHVCAYSLRGVRKVSPADWRAYTESCQPDVVFALSDTPFTDPPYSQKRLTKSIERSAAWLASLLGPASAMPSATSQGKAAKKANAKSHKTNTAAPVVVATTTSTTTTNTPSGPAAQNENENENENACIPPIFVHLAGLTSPGARKAFSDSLLEPLFGAEAEAIKPYKTLDEGVAGYVVDLVPLRSSVEAAQRKHTVPTTTESSEPAVASDVDIPSDTTYTTHIIPLLRTSLAALPPAKPRLITATGSPHEILQYVGAVGVDLFDAGWAQRAADVGVGLDFEFPVRAGDGKEKREVGCNLYDTKYRLDFRPLAEVFRGGASASTSASSVDGVEEEDKPICPCAACSPLAPSAHIYHGYDGPSVSGEQQPPLRSDDAAPPKYLPHYTRAYIHHLLHTHEMSAHALLAMHNLAVLDAFFAGIRQVISQSQSQAEAHDGHVDGLDRWTEEVRRFEEAYDGRLRVLEEAKERWREVDLARGKGRLAREKEKQQVQTTEAEE